MTATFSTNDIRDIVDIHDILPLWHTHKCNFSTNGHATPPQLLQVWMKCRNFAGVEKSGNFYAQDRKKYFSRQEKFWGYTTAKLTALFVAGVTRKRLSARSPTSQQMRPLASVTTSWERFSKMFFLRSVR